MNKSRKIPKTNTEDKTSKKKKGEVKGDNQDNATRKKWSKKKALIVGAIITIVLAGTGAGITMLRNSQQITSESFAVDEVMVFNGEAITMNEFLLYAADVYQGYNLQQDVDWDTIVLDSEGQSVTYEDKVKGTICEQIRMTKVLCAEATEQGVSLSNDEKELLRTNAQTYYANLTAANVVDDGLNVDLITKFYEENLLAQKIYSSIISGYTEPDDGEDDFSASDSALSAEEEYFLEVYLKLANKYDKKYDYNTSINWDLLSLLSFASISSADSNEEAVNSDVTTDSETASSNEATSETDSETEVETGTNE